MIRKGKGNRQFTMFGIMAVLLGSGDAFHLVPRAVALCTTGLENFTVQMGLGKWITSITMTILKSSPPQNLQQIVANFLYPFIFTHFNLGSLINLFSKSSSIELYTFSL